VLHTFAEVDLDLHAFQPVDQIIELRLIVLFLENDYHTTFPPVPEVTLKFAETQQKRPPRRLPQRSSVSFYKCAERLTVHRNLIFGQTRISLTAKKAGKAKVIKISDCRKVRSNHDLLTPVP
jgi:hypothetical protein